MVTSCDRTKPSRQFTWRHHHNSHCTMSQTFFPQFASVTATATVAYSPAGHGNVDNNGQPYLSMTSGDAVASCSRKVTEQLAGMESGCVRLSPSSSSAGVLERSDMSLPPLAESSSRPTVCIATVTPGCSHYAQDEYLGSHADQHSCFQPALLLEATSTASQYHPDSNADEAGGWVSMHQQEAYRGEHGCCMSNEMDEEVFQDSGSSWFQLDCYHQNDQRAGDFVGQFDFTDSTAAMASRYSVMHSEGPFIPGHVNFPHAQYDCSSTNTGPLSNDLSSSFYESENFIGIQSNTLDLVHPLQSDTINCSRWFETDLDDPLSYMSYVSFKGNLNEDNREGKKGSPNTLEKERINSEVQHSTKHAKTCGTFDEERQATSCEDTAQKTKSVPIADASKTNSGDEPSILRHCNVPICSLGETHSERPQNRLQQEQEQPSYACGRLQANPAFAGSQGCSYDPTTLPLNCPGSDLYSADHQPVQPTFLDSLHRTQPVPTEVARCPACPSQPQEQSASQTTLASYQNAENGHRSSPVVQSDNSSCSYAGSGMLDGSSLSSSSSSSSSPGKTTPLIDVDHLLSSGVTVAGFKPRPIIRKRRKVMMPSTQKDGSYWQKRKKNNDSAKRSREAKKEKEMNFYRRALELEYENYFLKERLEQLESQLQAVTGVTPTPLDYAALAARACSGVDSAAGLHNYCDASGGALNGVNVQHTSTDYGVT